LTNIRVRFAPSPTGYLHVGGARACPPEDCGGTDGHARLLEILFDPRHPEFEETRRRAGCFEPERFNPQP
jgi:hypothetical protein